MKRDYKRVPQLRKGTSGQIRCNGKSVDWRIPIFIVLILQGQALNAAEKQLTFASHGHILTNIGVWSADSQWIYYDIRSDHAGANFDGNRIERVHVGSCKTQTVYTSDHGACCGVVTVSPVEDRIVFIHGPEHPTEEWSYGAYHRRGVLVAANAFGTNRTENLDARNIVSPFTPGALRGGTHVHTFSGDGQWVSFTYEDHVLANRDTETANQTTAETNQRNVGVSVPVRSVSVPNTHPRNHIGSHFSVLVTLTHDSPEPGSDQISKAFSDAWIGTHGYLRSDGSRQVRAIAFQGNVTTTSGDIISEVFVVDLPNDVSQPSDAGPLEGTTTKRPRPPAGVVQRRLTFTQQRKFPGIQGERHWLRSHPDGSQIAFLMKDDRGIVQLWTVSPLGGDPKQLTYNDHDVASAFSWSPDGTQIAHVMDGSVCVTDSQSGITRRLTAKLPDAKSAPRPEACVFSPDSKHIAFVRAIADATTGEYWNQIFVADLDEPQS